MEPQREANRCYLENYLELIYVIWENTHVILTHGIWSHHFMATRWGNNGKSDRLYFGGLQNHCRWWLQPRNLKILASWKKSYDQLRQYIRKQRHCFTNRDPSSQSYGFSSSYVQMWELDYKKSWALKNGCFWTVVLEKTIESPLDCKEIQPVHPKGEQSWVFIGRTNVEPETPTLWPPDVKNWLTGRCWCWGRLKAGGERNDRGWGGWMASPTQWTWVWVSSMSWWWTGKPGMLQSMGSQTVGHHWATELNWTILTPSIPDSSQYWKG